MIVENVFFQAHLKTYFFSKFVYLCNKIVLRDYTKFSSISPKKICLVKCRKPIPFYWPSPCWLSQLISGVSSYPRGDASADVLRSWMVRSLVTRGQTFDTSNAAFWSNYFHLEIKMDQRS